jgi:hypothetical protein
MSTCRSREAHNSGRVRRHGLLAAAIAAGLVVVGCTSHGAAATNTSPTSSQSTSTVTGGGAATLDALRVAIPGSSEPVTLRATPPTGDAAKQLDLLSSRFGVKSSTPTEISSAATPLPPSGAVLTRTYPAALPPGVEAGFAYFDDELGGWHVAPSDLSADRTTLTATVHHFSPWTDFTSAAGAWAGNTVESADYHIGSFFDTRVDAPSCTGPGPGWTGNTTFVSDQNAPLRWCYGHDPAHPEWLVIKVRVNRGSGAVLSSSTAPQWSWNSFLNRDGLQITADIIKDYKTQAAQYLSAFASFGQDVPGGAEVDYGFTEDQVRNAQNGGLALVQAAKPDLTQLVMSLVVGAVADQVDDKTVAYTLGMLTVTHCGAAIMQAGTNWTRLAGAVTDCLIGAQDVITKEVAGYLAKTKPNLQPAEAVAKAKGATHALRYVVAAGVFFQLATYIGDLNLDEAARTFSVFPLAKKPPTPAPAGRPVATDSAFGPVALGMTPAQVAAATQAAPRTQAHCTTFDYSVSGSSGKATATVHDTEGVVITIKTPGGTKTDRGVGDGSTVEQVKAAYAKDRNTALQLTQDGQALAVTTDNPDNAGRGRLKNLIGFAATDSGTVGPPLIGGIPGYEYCSG